MPVGPTARMAVLHPGSRELAPPVQDANRMEYWRLSDVTL